MLPPPEYANYLSFLGFSDIEEPYTITAGTRVLRFHPTEDAIPDAAYSWGNITLALEWGLLLRSCRELSEAKNLIQGLARECGIWLEGFEPEKVWRRGDEFQSGMQSTAGLRHPKRLDPACHQYIGAGDMLKGVYGVLVAFGCCSG